MMLVRFTNNENKDLLPATFEWDVEMQKSIEGNIWLWTMRHEATNSLFEGEETTPLLAIEAIQEAAAEVQDKAN